MLAWPSFNQWVLDPDFHMTSSRIWILSNSSNSDERCWLSIVVRSWLSIMESMTSIEDRISRFLYFMLPNWLLAHRLRNLHSALSFDISWAPRSGLVGASEHQKEDTFCSKFGWEVHMFSKRNKRGCGVFMPVLRIRGIWSKIGLGRALVKERAKTSFQFWEYKKQSSLAHDGD